MSNSTWDKRTEIRQSPSDIVKWSVTWLYDKSHVTHTRIKLRNTWSTVAHQFRKSPAVDNYAQPVDTTLLCHNVTGWTRSGAGPFRSPVLLRGTLYRIVSAIQHLFLSVLENSYNGITCDLWGLNAPSAVEMFNDSSLYKSTIRHWHWHVQAKLNSELWVSVFINNHDRVNVQCKTSSLLNNRAKTAPPDFTISSHENFHRPQCSHEKRVPF